MEIELVGVSEPLLDQAKKIVKEAEVVAKNICFARDLVNLPANYLRPDDFVREVKEKLAGTG